MKLKRTNLLVDPATEALMCIDYAHHEIHVGSHFKTGKHTTLINTGEVIELLFLTPNTLKWAHWQLTAQTTGACTIELFEDTVTSDNGIVNPIWNRNRNSIKAPTVQVFHTPVITSDGTKFSEKWVGSSGFKENVGGEQRGDSEFVLKQNTKYLVRITAEADGLKAAIGGDWYEHTQLRALEE